MPEPDLDPWTGKGFPKAEDASPDQLPAVEFPDTTPNPAVEARARNAHALARELAADVNAAIMAVVQERIDRGDLTAAEVAAVGRAAEETARYVNQAFAVWGSVLHADARIAAEQAGPGPSPDAPGAPPPEGPAETPPSGRSD